MWKSALGPPFQCLSGRVFWWLWGASLVIFMIERGNDDGGLKNDDGGRKNIGRGGGVGLIVKRL